MTTINVPPAHEQTPCPRCSLLEHRNVPCLRTGARRSLASLPDLAGVVLFASALLMVSAFVASMS